MSRLELIKVLFAHGVPDEIVAEVMRLQAQDEALEERRKNDRERKARHVTSRDRTSVTSVTLPESAVMSSLPEKIIKEVKKEKKITASRGTRLPDGWQPSAETKQWAWREYHLDGEALSPLVDEFCDFWHAVPGVKGMKLDWDKTFKNRVRDVGRRYAATRAPSATVQRNGGKRTIHDELRDIREKSRRGESIALFPELGDGGGDSADGVISRPWEDGPGGVHTANHQPLHGLSAGRGFERSEEPPEEIEVAAGNRRNH